MARPGKKPAERYHHGDLRSGLLASAWRVVEREGVEGLSLRAVAHALGVSHAAPAHHFADKAALVGALRDEAWRRFADVLEAAEPGGLRAVGRAYVAFAREHPQVMQLMLRPLTGAPGEAAVRAWEVLRRSVEAVTGEGDEVHALAAWAMVQGLAVLPIEPDARRTDAILDVVERGIRARAGG